MTTYTPPPGYQTVTPYLLVRGLDALLGFLDRVFGIEVHEKLCGADGNTRHAEIRIGESMIMFGEAPGADFEPQPAGLYVYVPDVDSIYEQALAAGAQPIMPPADQFYGDRQGGVSDPAGNTWWVATRKKTLSSDELQRRARESWS